MTTSSDSRLLCAFSPGGAVLAIATPDGRVRVFDTSSGKLRATLGAAASSDAGSHVLSLTSGHLTEFHTCLAWVAAKGKKKSSGGSASLLVLGLASGDVKCYDAQLGEEKWRSVNVVEGGVLSVVCSPAGVVYATGRSCQIVALEAATGAVSSKFAASKYAISSVALSPDQQHLLGGGSSMQLWGVQAEEREAKFTGHPAEVRSITFAPSGTHAVSAGSGERHVAVWDVHSARKRPKKQHAAVASLSVEDPVVQLDTAATASSSSGSGRGHGVNGDVDDEGSSGQDDAFHVAAVSEAGEAYVWRVLPGSSSGSGGMEAELLARVRVGAGPARGAAAGRDEAILAAMLVPGQAGPSLLVARGTSARPAFERVPIPTSGSASDAAATSQADATAVISLQPSGGALLSSNGPQAGVDKSVAKQKAMGSARDSVTVLGPDNVGHAVLLRSATGHATAAAATATTAVGKKRAAPADPDAELPSEVSADGAVMGFEDEEEVPDLPEGEESLMDRLAALEGSADDRPAAGGQQPAGTLEAADDAEAGPSTSAGTTAAAGTRVPSGPVTADSLSVLLTQALRSGDRTLLERCFSSSSASAVINNTIARIAPQDASLFLKAAVDRLMSKPARAAALAPWLRALLHHHTGYLMTAPGAQAPLTALFQAIDARVRLHEPLLKVFGRLNLLSHHSAAVAGGGGSGSSGRAGGSSGSSIRPPPEVTFDDHLDEDDDEPAAEDAFNPGAVSDDEDEGSEDGEGDSGSSDEDGAGDADMEDDEDDDDFDDDDL